MPMRQSRVSVLFLLVIFDRIDVSSVGHAAQRSLPN